MTGVNPESMVDAAFTRGRAILERMMTTTVQFLDFDEENVVLETKCRYQPITIGIQRATSSTVYLYRDVRLQCPWDTDTTGIVPDMRFVVTDSVNKQLIGRGGTVTWAQDSDMVLERTILCKADMRELSQHDA